jgi:hypothetical protein
MKLISYICTVVVILTFSAIAWRVWMTRAVTIRKGEWVTNTASDETTFSFTVTQFAPYRSEALTELDGLAAIAIEVAPIKNHLHLQFSASNVTAELRDGTSARLRALRPMRFNIDQQVLQTSGNVPEMIDVGSRIGNASANNEFMTFAFADASSVVKLDANGADTITLGLILDAQFTNVQTLTVFGKALTN